MFKWNKKPIKDEIVEETKVILLTKKFFESNIEPFNGGHIILNFGYTEFGFELDEAKVKLIRKSLDTSMINALLIVKLSVNKTTGKVIKVNEQFLRSIYYMEKIRAERRKDSAWICIEYFTKIEGIIEPYVYSTTNERTQNSMFNFTLNRPWFILNQKEGKTDFSPIYEGEDYELPKFIPYQAEKLSENIQVEKVELKDFTDFNF